MDRIIPKSLQNRLKSENSLIQILIGPRQVGKTTAITESIDLNTCIFASADTPTPPSTDFIIENWKKARLLNVNRKTLVLDEVQKVPRWSEVVKSLWDEDARNKQIMNVWLLGSSALLIDAGLSESLAGRFESLFFPHWIYLECKTAFDVTIDEFVTIGAYPKVYSFKDDPERRVEYIHNSIIETTLGRDILALKSIEKPALLRRLFGYVRKLPSQIISFEKILGHVQGKGNSATLVHYAELLRMAHLLIPLEKYSSSLHRTKKSIPKWIIPNTALIDPGVLAQGFKEFVFENVVGAHLVNLTYGSVRYKIYYWREGSLEIDFIITEWEKPILAIEVKSGNTKKIKDIHIKSVGFECPFLVVHQNNVERFLLTAEVSQLLEMQTF